MEKKINLLDVMMILLFILVCFALTVAMIMYFSEESELTVFRISVDDETAEIIRQGDVLYDDSGSVVGEVVSIGSLGRQKTIDVRSDEPDIFRIGENIELRTLRIFLKGTVYSVKEAGENNNEE